MKVTIEKLNEIITKGLSDNESIIDVREHTYYLKGHIKGSINKPMSELMQTHGRGFNNDTKYYFISQKGESSSQVSEILKNFGYNAVYVEGGIDSYTSKYTL